LPERAPNPAMSELERWLLLALSVLVTRQRTIAQGGPDFVAISALRAPLQFGFEHVRGAHRCVLARARVTYFQASLLVLERQDFVSPVSALGPHIRLVDRSDEGVEAKLLPPLVKTLGLSDDDPVFAYYSPLQVLFDAETGFFDPRRESWHAYAGRALAGQLPGAGLEQGATATRLRWADGALELAGSAQDRLAVSGRTAALDFALEIEERGFALRLQALDAERGLAPALLRLRGADTLPVGVSVADEGPRGLVLRGRA